MKTFNDKKLARIQLLTKLCDTYAHLAYYSRLERDTENYETFREMLLMHLSELDRLTNCAHHYPQINV